MGTTLEEDQATIGDPKVRLEFRKYQAVKYRIEVKHILQQQVRLGTVLLAIMVRIKDLTPFEAACSRVFDLESKTGTGYPLKEVEHLLNRIMLGDYLNRLKVGLDRNREEMSKQAEEEAAAAQAEGEEDDEIDEEEDEEDAEEGEEEKTAETEKV